MAVTFGPPANVRVFQCEWYGADAGTNANVTKTTNAIQQALTEAYDNGGGTVTLTEPGTYIVNATLLIYSNTHLIVGSGVTIKMVDSAGGKPVMQNYAFSLRASPTTITLSWSSGTTAAITGWTAHGCSIGDYVWLQGATISTYNTIGYLSAASSAAGTATVNFLNVPSGAVSGTITALKCDRNITIDGGTFDYNYPSNTTGSSNLSSNCINLGIVQNLRINKLISNNGMKYALNLGAIRDFQVDAVGSNFTNSDMIKVQGPAINGHIKNTWGKCGDDGVSVQCAQPSGFPLFQWTNGDCVDIHVDGTNIESTLSGVGIATFYPTSTQKMINMQASRIGGVTNGGYGVKVFAEQSSTDTLTSLIVDGVWNDGSGNLRLARSSSNGAVVKYLRARGVGSSAESSASTPVLIDAGCTINDGEIELAINDPLFGSSGAAWAVTINGSYNRLLIDGIIAAGGTGRGITVAAGSVGGILMVSLEQRTGDQVVQWQSSTSSIIKFFGCDTTTAQVINPQTSCSLEFEGNRFASATNGIVRPTATPTVDIRSAGNNKLVSGSWVVVPSGTPVLTVYGWDIAIDPITLTGLATTDGQFFTSTQAGIEGGPSIRNAAGWVALGTGAAGVNTVIT